jgi:hypothetical protein
MESQGGTDKRWMDGYIDGWMEMDGWMDGCMDGWMNGCIDK